MILPKSEVCLTHISSPRSSDRLNSLLLIHIYIHIHRYMKRAREHNQQGGLEHEEKRRKSYRGENTRDQEYARGQCKALSEHGYRIFFEGMYITNLGTSTTIELRKPLEWFAAAFASVFILERSLMAISFFLMSSQYCLLMSSERWQWSSRNHSCLWSITTKKIVWRSSLPLIDDDSDGDLKIISECHRPWHEGWFVERICLWSMVS